MDHRRLHPAAGLLLAAVLGTALWVGLLCLLWVLVK